MGTGEASGARGEEDNPVGWGRASSYTRADLDANFGKSQPVAIFRFLFCSGSAVITESFRLFPSNVRPG